MNDLMLALASASAALALAGLVGTIVAAMREQQEAGVCEHAKPGWHCEEASCPNNGDVCVKCNTPEDAPWYSELDCTEMEGAGDGK